MTARLGPRESGLGSVPLSLGLEEGGRFVGLIEPRSPHPPSLRRLD